MYLLNRRKIGKSRSAADLFELPCWEAFTRYLYERQMIFAKRLRGELRGEFRPWTDDKVLQTYHFGNNYRILDYKTQLLLRCFNEREKELRRWQDPICISYLLRSLNFQSFLGMRGQFAAEPHVAIWKICLSPGSALTSESKASLEAFLNGFVGYVCEPYSLRVVYLTAKACKIPDKVAQHLALDLAYKQPKMIPFNTTIAFLKEAVSGAALLAGRKCTMKEAALIIDTWTRFQAAPFNKLGLEYPWLKAPTGGIVLHRTHDIAKALRMFKAYSERVNPGKAKPTIPLRPLENTMDEVTAEVPAVFYK